MRQRRKSKRGAQQHTTLMIMHLLLLIYKLMTLGSLLSLAKHYAIQPGDFNGNLSLMAVEVEVMELLEEMMLMLCDHVQVSALVKLIHQNRN